MNAHKCFSSKQIENSIISTTSVTADLRQAPGPPPRGRRCFPRNSSTRSAPLLLHQHRYDTRSTTRSSPHTGSPQDTSFIPYRNHSDMVDVKSQTQPTIQVNRHRLRQNQHANGPEINFDWDTNPSPFHFSGMKYKSTKNARGADRAPRPATEQGFTHSTEHNPARSKDTHGTSISALRYYEIATEGLQTDCTYFTALHPESCTATTCDNGTRAAHARGAPRAPSA